NGSASLFLGAKITHLGELPQGQPERADRVVRMVETHDAEGFGGCTNTGECAVACPKEIPPDVTSPLNRDHLAPTTQRRSPPRARRPPPPPANARGPTTRRGAP